MIFTNYPEFKERLCTFQLANGLIVKIIPKPNFNQTIATLSIGIGSLKQTFDLNHPIPLGSAHFLEHQLFEKKQYDIWTVFQNMGASINAATSFSNTSFTMETNVNVLTNIKNLLLFLEKPNFTNEHINKERKIIAQEIKLYEENIERKALFQLFNNILYNHPMKFSVGGTLDSIDKINRETLYNMFDYFYVTQNALLVISTPLDITVVHEYLTKESNKMNLNIKEDYIPHEMSFSEPKKVVKEFDEVFLPLIKEQIYIGIKITHNFKKAKLYYKLILEIYLEIILKRNSNFYIFIEDTFALIVIIDETENSCEYSEKIMDLIYSSKIEKTVLKKIINKKIGVLLDYSNSIGWLQKKYVTYYFDNMNFLEVIKILKNISFSEVEKTVTYLLKESTHSILSVKASKLS